MVKIVVRLLISMAIGLLLQTSNVWAAELAIVIDDFGYRQHNEEQIIKLSPNITVAVLPNSPNAHHIANIAHEHGNDVMIHLPMAPFGKQPLEKDTLYPYMEEEEVDRIVTNAVALVPYAIGVNNHMGSLMTSSQIGMENVMKALSYHSMFFLDSKTVGKTAVRDAASLYDIPVVERDVFLDDKQNEAVISQQFDLAIRVARKNGSAIAIGHPHPQTLNVLKRKLANLPSDIELIKISQLVAPLTTESKPKVTLKYILEHCINQLEDAWNFNNNLNK